MASPIRQGDTFLFGPATIPPHLCIVISDPEKDEDVLLAVSVTTARAFVDPACTLEVGDHPFIRHASFVHYRQAARYKKAFVQTLKRLEPISGDVLEPVIAGAAVSEFLAIEHYDFLADQGLFDEPA